MRAVKAGEEKEDLQLSAGNPTACQRVRVKGSNAVIGRSGHPRGGEKSEPGEDEVRDDEARRESALCHPHSVPGATKSTAEMSAQDPSALAGLPPGPAKFATQPSPLPSPEPPASGSSLAATHTSAAMSTAQGRAQPVITPNATTAGPPGAEVVEPGAPPSHRRAPPPAPRNTTAHEPAGNHSKQPVKAEDHYRELDSPHASPLHPASLPLRPPRDLLVPTAFALLPPAFGAEHLLTRVPTSSTASPPQGPPTPAATTASPGSFTIPLPSFVHDDPLSSDPDSSSDEDSFGQPKPPRPKRFSKSTGLARPTPSYYYDDEYDPGTAGTKKRGRRGGYKGVPVFEPTMEDFAQNGGFYGYVKRIEKYGLRSGIVKVVPPKEWCVASCLPFLPVGFSQRSHHGMRRTESLHPVDKPLRSIRLRDAIEQHMLGSQGLYRVMNEAKTRTWNAAQWKDFATRPKWEAPDLVGDEKKGERSERAVISDRARKMRASRAGTGAEASADKKGKGRAKDGEEADEEDGADGEGDDAAGSSKRRTLSRRAKVDGAAKMAAAKGRGKGKAAVDESPDDAGGEPDTSASDAAPPPPAKKRRASMAPANPTDEEWAAFCAGLEELPHGMTRDDYTVERMRDFERRYWRTLTFGEPPMYGADMAGSLFDDSTKAWNVAHLGDLLPKLAPRGCEIPGVVTPYLYFGMWRATFAWHVEDADLYSINYIHFGAPKFWYSVPQEQSERFERVMAGASRLSSSPSLPFSRTLSLSA